MEFTNQEVEVLRGFMQLALAECGQDALVDETTITVARRLSVGGSEDWRGELEHLIQLRADGV